jgi:hypothetical protein
MIVGRGEKIKTEAVHVPATLNKIPIPEGMMIR